MTVESPIRERVEPVSTEGFGPCRLGRASVEESRKFLYQVGITVRKIEAESLEALRSRFTSEGRWLLSEPGPSECPSIEESMASFVPTAVLWRTLRWSDRPILQADTDDLDDPRFLSSIYAVDRVRDNRNERTKRMGGQTFLLPPAQPSEAGLRAEIAQRSGRGVPLFGDRAFSLTRQLEPREISRLRRMSLGSQLAVVAILAARSGSVAFLSPRGGWPSSRFIEQIAMRLDCRIHRFGMQNVRRSTWRSLRSLQYRSANEPAGEE